MNALKCIIEACNSADSLEAQKHLSKGIFLNPNVLCYRVLRAELNVRLCNFLDAAFDYAFVCDELRKRPQNRRNQRDNNIIDGDSSGSGGPDGTFLHSADVEPFPLFPLAVYEQRLALLYFQIGWHALQVGDIPSGKAFLRRARCLDTSVLLYATTLARLLLCLGEYHEALSTVRDVMDGVLTECVEYTRDNRLPVVKIYEIERSAVHSTKARHRDIVAYTKQIAARKMWVKNALIQSEPRFAHFVFVLTFGIKQSDYGRLFEQMNRATSSPESKTASKLTAPQRQSDRLSLRSAPGEALTAGKAASLTAPMANLAPHLRRTVEPVSSLACNASQSGEQQRIAPVWMPLGQHRNGPFTSLRKTYTQPTQRDTHDHRASSWSHAALQSLLRIGKGAGARDIEGLKGTFTDLASFWEAWLVHVPCDVQTFVEQWADHSVHRCLLSSEQKEGRKRSTRSSLRRSTAGGMHATGRLRMLGHLCPLVAVSQCFYHLWCDVAVFRATLCSLSLEIGIELLVLMSVCSIMLDRPDEAIRYAVFARSLQFDNPDCVSLTRLLNGQWKQLFASGLALALAGNLSGAHISLSKAIELQPQEPALYIARGNVSRRMHRFQDALSDLGKGALILQHLSLLATKSKVGSKAQAKVPGAPTGSSDRMSGGLVGLRTFCQDGIPSGKSSIQKKANNLAVPSSKSDRKHGLSPSKSGTSASSLLQAEAKSHNEMDRGLSMRDSLVSSAKTSEHLDEMVRSLLARAELEMCLCFDQLGDLYLSESELDSALVCYSKAFELNSDAGAVLVKRGRCYQIIGETTRALADFRNARDCMDAPPDYVVKQFIMTIHHQRGVDLFADNDWEGAEIEFTRALKEAPDMARLYLDRAKCFEHTYRFTMALRDLERARQLEPDNRKVADMWRRLRSRINIGR